MTLPLLPAPDAPDDGTPGAGPAPGAPPGGGPQRPRGASRPRAAIPSVEEILEKLLQLNGLVCMGLLSTAQATVIQRNLRTVLDAQLKRAQGGGPGLPQEALAAVLRANPALLNLLEPFLTDAQVASIFESSAERPSDAP